jgi:hypothetical protein
LNPKGAWAYYNLIELCQKGNKEQIDKVAGMLKLNKNKGYFKIDIANIMSQYKNIDELIKKLLDTGYDDYFSQTLNKYSKN